MKVKELIERLEGMNPDSEIALKNMSACDQYGYWLGEAEEIAKIYTENNNTVLDGGIRWKK